jgi:hypothetical protein
VDGVKEAAHAADLDQKHKPRRETSYHNALQGGGFSAYNEFVGSPKLARVTVRFACRSEDMLNLLEAPRGPDHTPVIASMYTIVMGG